MSSAANSKQGRRHTHERHWLAFVKTQHSSYIRESVSWLEAEFPGSVAHCIDDLRKFYREAKAKEERSNAL